MERETIASELKKCRQLLTLIVIFGVSLVSGQTIGLVYEYYQYRQQIKFVDLAYQAAKKYSEENKARVKELEEKFRIQEQSK